MTTYNREVTIDGVALRSATWFEVDSVRLDAPAELKIASTQRADTDGEYLLSKQYVSKRVILQGHFAAPQRWDYEQGRDKLLELLNTNNVCTIVTEQSGENRAFAGTYENIQFDYKESGFCMVTITFKITGAFGVSVTSDIPVNRERYTTDFSFSFDVKGSAKALPIISMTLNSLSDYANPVPFVFETLSKNILARIEIKRVWSANDELTIDCEQKTVKVNGISVDYIGMFPEILGSTTFSVHDDALSRDCIISLEYNRRWL